MAITEREREYFRRIGEWKAQSHADARAYHLSLPVRERLVRSLNSSIPWRDAYFARLRAGEKPPQVEPGVEAFYERARALGIISVDE